MTTEQRTDIAPRREVKTVSSSVPMLDTAVFEHMQRLSSVMANASLIPDHIRGRDYDQTFANCFLITNQAMRWKMDPWALMQSCFLLHGKIGYEGKLIAAVIEDYIGAPIDYEWEGTPGTDAFSITVTAPRPSDGKRVSITGDVGSWKTFEKDGKTVKANWRGLASRNQLAYRGVREWGRLYAPGIMLGVYDPEDLDDMFREQRMRDITPPSPEDADDAPKRQRGRPRKNQYQEEQPAETSDIVDVETGEVTETEKKVEEKPAPAKVEKQDAGDPPAPDEDEPKKETKAAAKKPAAVKDPPAPTETKAKTLEEIFPKAGEAPAEVRAVAQQLHDEMARSDELGDKSSPAPTSLRAIFRKLCPASGREWPVKWDPMFDAVRDYHRDRVENAVKEAAERKKEEASPPAPDENDNPPAPQDNGFDYPGWLSAIEGDFRDAKDADAIQQILTDAVEIMQREGHVTEKQIEEDVRPLAARAMARFD